MKLAHCDKAEHAYARHSVLGSSISMSSVTPCTESNVALGRIMDYCQKIWDLADAARLESLKPVIELAIIETFVVSGASTDEEVKRLVRSISSSSRPKRA